MQGLNPRKTFDYRRNQTVLKRKCLFGRHPGGVGIHSQTAPHPDEAAGTGMDKKQHYRLSREGTDELKKD
jgi:hypothetical protein